MEALTKSTKWEAADKAFNKGVEAYIEFGQECARLNSDGTTQQEIGNRYGMSQQQVGYALTVGKDERITSNTCNLPRSTYALYLLTTLDDQGFAKLAKPDTTQADIKKYKEAQQPQKPKSLPSPEKEKEVKAPTPAKFNTVMNDTGLPSGKANTEAVLSIMGLNEVPKKMTTEMVEKVADATRTVLSMRGKTIEDTRAEIKTLSETNQKKLERLEATLVRQLEADFDRRVREAAKAMIPDLMKRCEEREREATEELRDYALRKQGIKPHLTEADYRFLRQTIAPDRYPEEYRDKLTKAAQIINQFDKYVGAFKLA